MKKATAKWVGIDEKRILIEPPHISDISINRSEQAVRDSSLFFYPASEHVYKNHKTIIEACKVLKEKGYTFVCDFVGSETQEISRSRFDEDVHRLKLQDCVTFHGPQYGNEKLGFFHRADLFVQPTFDDCFPLTILEAMACGLPVVATDEGASPIWSSRAKRGSSANVRMYIR
jgi:glycosyltransferase involved in cell wall biosynthesis